MSAWRRLPAAAADVSICELGTLGGPVSQAKAVNRRGHVVGTSRDGAGRSRAFLWTADRGISDLQPSTGVNSSANDINDPGDIVGGGDTGFGAFHAYLLSEGTALDLGTLGGSESEALAVNEVGQVAGHSRVSEGAGKHAFCIPQPGRMLDLGTLGGAMSVAHGVNDRAVVVGLAETERGAAHAFRWSEGEGMGDLGTLGGGASMALGINNRGDVVGGSGRAFLWTERSGMIDLGTLGGRTSCACAVNDAGAIVGVSQTGKTDRRGRRELPVSHAFLRMPDGRMVDLGTLGGADSAAVAISAEAAGVCFIAGHSHDVSGAIRAVVWSVRLG
ncbi:MAG TPA: hypothetical protein VEU55_06280 [Gemmatimonadales bacterium]|nr:hypothetical protein [Gemmatimonadales bacterium]